MHSRRAILLASSALVGIGSLTVWQDQALAAVGCAAVGTVVTCSGPSDSASDNVVIATVFPTVTVNADATALIDTKTGGAPLTVPATANGTVTVSNLGLIGLLPGDGGLTINGDPTKAANNATASNTKTINGNLIVGAIGSRLGGTGTIVNGGTVSGNAIIWSLGNATLTSNTAGAIINGTVTVESTDSTTTTPAPVAGVTTTKTLGGLAAATVGDVGVAGGAKTHSNPDGFAGKTVTLFGIAGASGTFSGHTGNVNIQSYNEVIVSDDGSGTVVDAGGLTTLTTKSSDTDTGGPTSATVSAGAQVLGDPVSPPAMFLDSPGGASLEIAGTVGTSKINEGAALPANQVYNAVWLFPGSYDGTSTVETTVTKDSDAVLLSDTTVFSSFSDGGGATFTVDAGGQVNGTTLIQSDLAQTVIINGNTGKATQKFITPTVNTANVDGSITLESDAFKNVETVTTTWTDNAGIPVLATFSDVSTSVGVGGNINFTVGATGNVFGAVDITTGGGNLTVLVNGIIGDAKNTISKFGLTANTSAVTGSAFGTLNSEVDTYDPTGAFPVSTVLMSGFTQTGGNFDLTVGATGVINGLVRVTAGDPTLLVDGTINGAVQLDAYAHSSLDTTTFTYDAKDAHLTNYVDVDNINTDLSQPITATIDATGKILGTLDLETGADVNVTIAGQVGSGIFDATFNPDPANGVYIFTEATDRTTSDTRVYDKTGAIITSRQLTDLQAASGGAVNITIAAGGNVNGNVEVFADGNISFTNNGGVERSFDATTPVPFLVGSGNVRLVTDRSLETQNNSSPIGNNFVTTVIKDAADVNILSTETVNKGSSSTIDTSVGGSLTIVNTSLLTIDGNLIGSALGNISLVNSGWIVGSVDLTSSGFLDTVTHTSSTDNLVAYGDSTNPLIHTTQTVTIVPNSTNYNEVDKDIGGSVTSTISGIVGVDPTNVDAVALKAFAGTHFIQTAETTSALSITGTGIVYMPVTSQVNQGTGTYTYISTQTVTDVLTSVAEDLGKGIVPVLSGGTITAVTTYNQTFTPALATASTVTVAGKVLLSPTGAWGNVNSEAPFGATIADSGTVEGDLFAYATDTATTYSDTTNQAFGIDTSVVTDPLSANLGKPASTGAAIETSYLDTQVWTYTGAGGAAAVSITGTGVAWEVDAEGTTGATVTIDTGAKVLKQGVYAGIVVSNDRSETLTTKRTDAGTKVTQVVTDTQSSNPAAVAAKANTLITQNGAVIGSIEGDAGTGNATVLVNNTVRPGTDGSSGGVTAIASIDKYAQTSSTTTTGKLTVTSAAIKLTPAGAAIKPLPTAVPDLGVLIPDLGVALIPTVTGGAASSTNIKLGSILDSKFSSSYSYTSAGGNAVITLTPPAAIVAAGGNTLSGILVTGDLFARGDTSATVTNNAGSRVMGSGFGNYVISLPRTAIGALTGISGGSTTPVGPYASTTETYNKLGNLDSRTLVESNTYTGGTALLTNNGELRDYIVVNSAGTSTFNNGGVVGTYNGGNGSGSGFFTGTVTVLVNSLQTSWARTITDTALSDPLTLALDPGHATSTTVVKWTPTGGTSNLLNSGAIWGETRVVGGTVVATNTSTGSMGFSVKSSPGFALTIGSGVGNHTETLVRTPNSPGSPVILASSPANLPTGGVTTTINPLFAQNSTVNQGGLVMGGIFVTGAMYSDTDPSGTFVTNITSKITSTINLNDNSLTTASNTYSDSGLNFGAIVGEMAGDKLTSPLAAPPDQATFLTTTTVNLNGNDYIGLNSRAFTAHPIFTQQQLEFFSSATGLSTDALKSGNYEAQQGAAVVGVTALNRNAGGTTYFVGLPYDNENSTRQTDDLYSIRATAFNVLQGGAMEFAMGDFDPVGDESDESSFEPEGNEGNGNFAAPPSDILGISGVINNSGTFVLGARASETIPANFSGVVLSAPLFVRGLNFRVDGGFTQSSTGILVTGVVPSLLRGSEPFITNTLANEILAVPGAQLNLPLFTTPAKSTIVTSTPSEVFLTGNLSLAGTVQVAIDRNAIYAVNQTTPLFVVTPSVNAVTGAVSTTAPTVAVTAAVTTSIPSSFLGFTLTTATTGAGAATVTTVSLVTQRKSFATVVTSSNAIAAAHALDSDVSSIVPAITNDANGTGGFSSVAAISNAQDEAGIISAFDFLLSPGQVAAALNDLAGGSFYGSVRAFDTSRVLRDGFDTEAAGATDMDRVGLAIWANPIFRSTKLDGNSSIGTGDITGDEGGVTAGVDFRFSNNIGVGVGGGYTKNRLKDSDPATADVDSWIIGSNIYYVRGPWLVSGQIDYARSNYSVNRQLPAMSREAHAEFGGTELRGQAEVGYKFYMIAADGDLTPYLAIDWRRAETHAFSETGAGGVSLVVNGKSDSIVNPRIGLRWDGTNWGTSVFTVKPKIEGSYTFSNDIDTDTTMTFAGGTSPFTTQGTQGKGYGTIQLGVVGSVGQTGSIGITGGFDFGGNRTATSISANFRIEM